MPSNDLARVRRLQRENAQLRQVLRKSHDVLDMLGIPDRDHPGGLHNRIQANVKPGPRRQDIA